MSLTTRFQDTELTRLLEERGVLVADGGIGTTLMALGLDADTPPELWNVERPDEITAVHHAYVEAGADIILTDTFGANRLRLAHRGWPPGPRSSTLRPGRSPVSWQTQRSDRC